MEIPRIISRRSVHCLPLHLSIFLFLLLQVATAQYGMYFDNVLMNYKFYQSLPCKVNNFYEQAVYDPRTLTYTVRNDINCCYLAGTRNDCCEEAAYDGLTNTFTNTCKCSPTVNCGNKPGTGPSKPNPNLFCPALGGRVLNSAEEKACGEFNGVFPVMRKTPPLAVCNVVLAQAMVKGVRKTTLVTTQFCNKLVEAAIKFSGDLSIKVSPTVSIPVKDLTRVKGNDGAAFFEVSDANVQQLTSVCKKMSCGLRHPEMTGKVDYNDCKVLSYGSYDAGTLAQKGLRSIGVRIYPQGCRNVQIISGLDKGEVLTNSMCFTTKDQVPILCSGDYGAPVFCKSTTTPEFIVVGMLAATNRCGATTSFGVIRFPTY